MGTFQVVVKSETGLSAYLRAAFAKIEAGMSEERMAHYVELYNQRPSLLDYEVRQYVEWRAPEYGYENHGMDGRMWWYMPRVRDGVKVGDLPVTEEESVA